MKLGYVLVGLAGFGLGYSIYYGAKQDDWLLQNSSMILGWALLLIQTSYVHVEKIYWWVQRFKYNILNPDTIWDLSIKYKINALNEGLINKVQGELFKAASLDRAELIRLSNQRLEIRADELIIELILDYENDLFQVFFRKLPVSFRGTQRVLNTRICPVIEAIEKHLIISSKYYWLSVYFGDVNPFFGLYMRRLKQAEIAEFNIRLKSKDHEKLAISKDKITICTQSLSELSSEGRNYLTLSKLPV